MESNVRLLRDDDLRIIPQREKSDAEIQEPHAVVKGLLV